MAKRVKRLARRASRDQGRQTNWWLVGGIIVAGVVVVFALLFLALREPEAKTLTQYCLDNSDSCIFKGSADAPVSIVELSDYGCSHCRDFNLQTAGLLKDLYVNPGDVQWIVMPFALGPGTFPVATAAMCANDQGQFEEYHQRMFELQGNPAIYTPEGLSLEGLSQVASELGMDQAVFDSCVENAVYDNVIQENIREASLAGVNATPTFFINGKKLGGNYPLTTFQEEIASALGGANAQ